MESNQQVFLNDSNFFCVICLSISDNPKVSACCSQIYCQACQKKLLGQKCAYCRKTDLKFQENLVLQRMISLLQVCCKNCKTKISLNNYREHIQKCQDQKIQNHHQLKEQKALNEKNVDQLDTTSLSEDIILFKHEERDPILQYEKKLEPSKITFNDYFKNYVISNNMELRFNGLLFVLVTIFECVSMHQLAWMTYQLYLQGQQSSNFIMKIGETYNSHYINMIESMVLSITLMISIPILLNKIKSLYNIKEGPMNFYQFQIFYFFYYLFIWTPSLVMLILFTEIFKGKEGFYSQIKVSNIICNFQSGTGQQFNNEECYFIRVAYYTYMGQIANIISFLCIITVLPIVLKKNLLQQYNSVNEIIQRKFQEENIQKNP